MWIMRLLTFHVIATPRKRQAKLPKPSHLADPVQYIIRRTYPLSLESTPKSISLSGRFEAEDL
jgi:hypothetical protein